MKNSSSERPKIKSKSDKQLAQYNLDLSHYDPKILRAIGLSPDHIKELQRRVQREE